MRTLLGATLAIALAVAAHGEVFEATAYSDHGETASGHTTRHGVVAADPHVLPLGTRIRITGAGRYSGEYVVRDTGQAIEGRTVDIFIGDARAAKRFGRKQVKVDVLEWGDGRATAGRR